MKKRNIPQFILIIISILLPLSAVYGEVQDFKKIIEDYLSVNTIKASITQYIYAPDGSAEVFSGNYFAASGGFIKIDYLQPERQTVAVNGEGLFWYYNERKLLFLSEKKEQSGGSIPVLMSVIPSESLKDIDIISEGMKFYSIFKIVEVYSVTSKKNKTKMVLWVDPALKIIKRKYILDEEGREMVKEDYTNHALVNGVYIPSKIELKARTSSGVIHTVTEYGNIIINSRIDKDFFKFEIKPEMKVRVLGDR